MAATHILFETSSGYALFERLQSDEIGQELAQVQQAMLDLSSFSKVIKLKSFAPFKSAADALENSNDISEGVCNPTLKAFIELNLPKKKSVLLGVMEKNLAGAVKGECGVECTSDETVQELGRGIRFHAAKIMQPLREGDLEKAQLGLGHSYSRAKVKFNVHRSDNMIIQAISMLDQLDKDINTFAMRVREWYSWHFPELVKIVNDNALYTRLAQFIGNKAELSEDKLEGLEEIVGDEGKARQIIDAAKSSMGTDISDVDLLNIETFAARLSALIAYRKNLQEYLSSKMAIVAPNLSSLIGDFVGARLISHAGSLTNLSKYPASTVQILGAEKALFRALKTKGNTPKYGLIYHSSFIGRAGQKNKGRISRFLANKCSIASRIDCFTDKPTTKFGEALKSQVEERLKFFESGDVPKKNSEVMSAVINELSNEMDVEEDNDDEPQAAQSGKRKVTQDADGDVEMTTSSKPSKKSKSSKKEKKDKKAEDAAAAAPAENGEKESKKSKKSKKSKN
ncbi:Nucleolar protein 56 [Sorochytrium milnesiophthora]